MASASVANAANTQTPEGLALTVTRRFKAPRPLVYRMFTDKAHLVRWFGPVGFTAPDCALEPTPGGRFYCDMLSPDGNHHRVQGTFREVVPDRRVVFTWSWLDAEGKPKNDTVVSIDLADRGSETELTLEHRKFPNAEQRDDHNKGWLSCFVCLDAYLATLAA